MITEEHINTVVLQMENAASEENDKSIDKHVDYFDYLDQDSSVLFDEEKEYLYGIVFVLLESCGIIIEDLDALINHEESNWEVVQSHKLLKEAFDTFFFRYPEEDLLAYVEDSLSVDPEEEDFEFLTQVGIEFMVVKAKSIIDYYIEQRN